MSKITQIIISLIIITKIYLQEHKICTFKYKKEIPKEISSENIFDFLYKNNIQITIDISNKHFKIPLNLKLRQYPFFFTSPEAYPNHQTFNFEESPSFMGNPQKLHFTAYDFLYGFKGNDTIFINDVKLFQYNFFIGTKLRENIGESGSIGLNIEDPEVKYNDINFIYQLQGRNLVSTHEFTFKFINDDDGELIIGAKPHEYDKSHYKEENYKSLKPYLGKYNNNYDIQIDGIYFNDVNVTEKEKNIVQLSIENGFIVGNINLFKEVKKDFFNKYLNTSECFENYIQSQMFYFYNCNQNINIRELKPISFYIESVNFTFQLTYEDLFYKHDNSYYFLVVFKITGFDLKWVLGKPFLKKYQFVFDQNSKLVGFYTEFIKPEKEIKWEIILYILVGLLILISIIFVIKKCLKCKKSRKIRSNKVKDAMKYIRHTDKIDGKNILGI